MNSEQNRMHNGAHNSAHNGIHNGARSGAHTISLRNIWLLSAAVVFLMFAISSYAWMQIPAGEEVCTHWNAAGECDDYGSKFVGIYLMPIVTAAVVGLFALIPRIDPRAANIARSRKSYTAVWAAVILFFLALHTILTLSILDRDVNIGTYVPLLVGFMLVAIGNYMGKIRSNYMFGIRTPWTLSSELAWNKTHRLGGKLFVVEGIIIMAGAIFLQDEWWTYLMLGSIFLMVAVLTGYSYLIWRQDPAIRAR